MNRLLEQRFSNAEVKTVSRDTRNIKGTLYFQALINGNLTQMETHRAAAVQPQFLTSEQFRQRITALCQEAGLTIKQFEAGSEKREANLFLQPIKFRAFGLKAKATTLLRQIMDENLNVSFSKISLIANDVDSSNPYISLVINIGLYRE